jgi:hypothetical protein
MATDRVVDRWRNRLVGFGLRVASPGKDKPRRNAGTPGLGAPCQLSGGLWSQLEPVSTSGTSKRPRTAEQGRSSDRGWRRENGVNTLLVECNVSEYQR